MPDLKDDRLVGLDTPTMLPNLLILRLFAFGFRAPQPAEDETTLSASPPLHTALRSTGER